jgi:hypothetical protein
MRLSAKVAALAWAGVLVVASSGGCGKTPTEDSPPVQPFPQGTVDGGAGGGQVLPDGAAAAAAGASGADAKPSDSPVGDAPADKVATDGPPVPADAAKDTGVPDVDFSYEGGGVTPWSQLPKKCADAAEKGVAWLATQQKTDGSWGSSSPYQHAATGLAVVKLETHAIDKGKSPFDPTYQYHTHVVNGLKYLLKQFVTSAVQAPFDTNGNGLGVAMSGQSNYVNSIALMALTAGRGTNQIAVAPGTPVHGWKFDKIAQDMADYFSQCQVASQGGWRYGCPSSNCDNSVSQYVSLALEYAEHPDYAFMCTIPQVVRTNLWTWVGYVQDMNAGSPNYGGSGYTNPGSVVNPYKTGAILQQLAFLKQGATTQKAQAALQYLDKNWSGPIASNPADYMAMWAIMKGLVAQGVTKVGAHDWYQEYCDVLVAQQKADGSWPMAHYDNQGSGGALSVAWALLILEKAAPAGLY